MDLFDYLFAPCMILFPAVFTLFFRNRSQDPEHIAAGARLQRLLWAATVASLAVYLVLARWQPATAYFMWILFFPLWFLLAMPVLRARDPGWRAPERSDLRSASLVRRDRLSFGLRLAWILLGILWGLILCASVAGLALSITPAPQWWLLGFNLAAGAEIALLHWAMRRSLIEPEATSPDESDEIRAERDRFQRLKLYGWTVLAALVMLVFSLPPLILIWYGYSALDWAIAVGAGGGALVGIGGGVFGTAASIQRARINRLRIETSAQE